MARRLVYVSAAVIGVALGVALVRVLVAASGMLPPRGDAVPTIPRWVWDPECYPDSE